jgi:tryptophan synthase beta chain
LLHTGAHKINNCMGQVLLARRMGKTRVIAETGAGQHGVATATVAAMFGLKLRHLHGGGGLRAAGVERLSDEDAGGGGGGGRGGAKTLKEAINEAMRDWVTNVRTTHYILGRRTGRIPTRSWCGISSG